MKKIPKACHICSQRRRQAMRPNSFVDCSYSRLKLKKTSGPKAHVRFLLMRRRPPPALRPLSLPSGIPRSSLDVASPPAECRADELAREAAGDRGGRGRWPRLRRGLPPECVRRGAEAGGGGSRRPLLTVRASAVGGVRTMVH